MNHRNRPGSVTVTTSVHELFLKVSTRPAKLTWLGLTFPGSKRGGKTSKVLLDSQELQQAGDLKTAGALCSLRELPLHGAWQSWHRSAGIKHPWAALQDLMAALYFSSILKLICYPEKWIQVTHWNVKWKNLDITQTHDMQFFFLQ